MTKTTLIRLFSLFPDSGADSRSAPRIGLQRLLGLRILVAGSSLAGALLFNIFSPLELPLLPVALVLSGIVLSVLIGYWRVNHAGLITHGELVMQLGLDFVFATILLMYTGGSSNPLISYLLVLLAVGATLLRSLWAHLFALLAILIHTAFLAYGIISDEHSQHMPNFQLHLVGMWVTFVVSAVADHNLCQSYGCRHTQQGTDTGKVTRKRVTKMNNWLLLDRLRQGPHMRSGTPLSTMAVLLSVSGWTD